MVVLRRIKGRSSESESDSSSELISITVMGRFVPAGVYDDDDDDDDGSSREVEVVDGGVGNMFDEGSSKRFASENIGGSD